MEQIPFNSILHSSASSSFPSGIHFHEFNNRTNFIKQQDDVIELQTVRDSFEFTIKESMGTKKKVFLKLQLGRLQPGQRPHHVEEERQPHGGQLHIAVLESDLLIEEGRQTQPMDELRPLHVLRPQ